MVAALAAILLAVGWPGASHADNVVQRRQQVLAAAAKGAASIPVLQRALDDENALVRRAAIRGLVDIGPAATPAITAALSNNDAVVRRAALLMVAGDGKPDSLPHLEKAMADADPGLRALAVQMLVAITPRTDQIMALIKQAATDKAPDVQMIAGVALAAAASDKRPFSVQPPDRVLLRQRPDMADHITRITVGTSLQLPREGWKFRFDPSVQGHVEKWHESGYNDSQWGAGVIETPWTAGYVGVGWYRLQLDLPARPDHLAAELLFEGVDENAWVWVNGVYVGGQDIGPSGWDQAFRVDVTEELRWGARNQITVRARNTAHAGGIWKPIKLETLKLK
jgi:hypothetical protein